MDFITPVVDDPYQWGRIAAANSISDVFAMGGAPLVCLNVVAFPINCLPLESLAAVMRGGSDAVTESGAFLMGGHSVEDPEPKYGLCVFGEAERSCLWRTTGAKPGDAVILTKPVGTGVAATAIKGGMTDLIDPAEAVRWMGTLNDLPRHLSPELKRAIHAATDVTGFGLAGHALDMLSDGTVDSHFELEKIPLLTGVTEAASMGLLPAGAYRNQKLYAPHVAGACGRPEEDFLYDPQTSGGLMLACDPRYADQILNAALANGFTRSQIIGTCSEGNGTLHVE